jgi:hypothetical protein
MNPKLVIALVALLYVLAMWIFIGWVFYRAWGQSFKNRLSPIVRVPAVVLSKEQEAKYLAEYDKAEITRRFIKFDCKDGEQREFEVPAKLFDSVSQGDYGTLQYRGTALVSFDGARIPSDVDEMYKRLARR